MNGILNFLKKLIPRIDRTSILEDLRTTEKEIQNVNIPSWDSAVEYFRINKAKSAAVKNATDLFYRFFQLRGATKSNNLITEIAKRLPALSDNAAYLHEVVSSELERDIITAGLTARKSFLIRAASNISFISRYLPSLLNYLYMHEAEALDGELEESLKITKAEISYVEKHFEVFCKLFSQYSIPRKELEKLIGSTPEVHIGGDSAPVAAGFYSGQGSKLDPFDGFGVANFIGNPIYRVRLVIAQWQNNRYEAAKSKKQQLELRLLYLKSAQEKETNPALMREIEILQGRIEKYDRELREVEEGLDIHEE